jgi:molecular chaperone DnaK
MKRIGIDLGTTNTVLAVEGEVRAIGDEGASLLPSVVAFLPNGSHGVGAGGRRRRVIDPRNTIFSSKRIIGRTLDHSNTRAFCQRYPFEVVDAGDQTPAFDTRSGLYSPTDVAALILGRVQEQLGPDVVDTEAVITVPFGFGEAQCRATLTAASQAGFANVRLIDEPTATAWAYRAGPGLDGVLAVYDLGGGTFDLSIVDCSGNTPRFLAGESESYLGGDDIDHQIAEWVTEEVLKEHNWDLGNSCEVAGRLLAECERAKIRLSDETETWIELAEVDPECPIAGEGLLLRRGVLDRLVTQLVQRTFVLCDEVLQKAKLRSSDLSGVLLAGGSAHLPVIRQGLEAYFGCAPRIDVEPTEVVARGASLVVD